MSSGSPYYVGGEAVVSIQWSDPAQTIQPIDPNTGYTFVNPSTVTLTVRKPDNTEITPTVNQNGFVYSAKIPFDQAGVWRIGWTAGGTYIDYRETTLTVRARNT